MLEKMKNLVQEKIKTMYLFIQQKLSQCNIPKSKLKGFKNIKSILLASGNILNSIIDHKT